MTDTIATVAVIPGDGIGTEVTPAAVRVLDETLRLHGTAIQWNWLDWGCDYFVTHGRMMPSDGLDVLADHDAILLGAVGRPDVPDHESLWGLLIPIRQRFDQYVNLRPIKSFHGVQTAARIPAGVDVDMLIIRENTEGEYTQLGGRFATGTQREFAIQEAIFTRTGIDRIADYAFRAATTRRNKVTSATKSNGIIHTMPFWDDVVAAAATRHPDVHLTKELIDALAAHLVQKPQEYDVIVASNLFGDILSDLAAAIVGGLGLAPSANLNPERAHPSMFEPVHGSAPDIAGRGVANPVAAVWSGALMLEHLGHAEPATKMMTAIATTLASPATRTQDLGGTATTSDVVTACLATLA
ncbi:tartrate dehydrogenase [Dactylosporangium sp. NPDC050588]|uniref:tartrate dehydrogenase n=1 Tax=Dactylosporangium sp. NPDC050588 TaxID=3157211 RepID=UPI0033E9796A